MSQPQADLMVLGFCALLGAAALRAQRRLRELHLHRESRELLTTALRAALAVALVLAAVALVSIVRRLAGQAP